MSLQAARTWLRSRTSRLKISTPQKNRPANRMARISDNTRACSSSADGEFLAVIEARRHQPQQQAEPKARAHVHHPFEHRNAFRAQHHENGLILREKRHD